MSINLILISVFINLSDASKEFSDFCDTFSIMQNSIDLWPIFRVLPAVWRRFRSNVRLRISFSWGDDRFSSVCCFLRLTELITKVFHVLNRQTAFKYPNLTALYSIGTFQFGMSNTNSCRFLFNRKICSKPWFMGYGCKYLRTFSLLTAKFTFYLKKVSSSPYEHMLGKPDVKYVGGIHGNEAVGRELLLHLIQYFVTNYHTDSYVKWLLDNTRIHILPSLNVSEFVIGIFMWLKHY